MAFYEEISDDQSTSAANKFEAAKSPGFDERALIARCREEIPENTKSYKELVRIYRPYAVNVAIRLLNAREDAEEVAQDSLLQVFHKLHTFEGRSSFRTWFHIIVLNSARKRLSKVKTRQKVEKDIAENYEEPTPNDVPNDQIQDALQRLSPDQKEVIVLRFFSGMKMDEMADALGIGASAAKMRLYRAMEAFKVSWSAVERTNEL